MGVLGRDLRFSSNVSWRVCLLMPCPTCQLKRFWVGPAHQEEVSFSANVSLSADVSFSADRTCRKKAFFVPSKELLAKVRPAYKKFFFLALSYRWLTASPFWEHQLAIQALSGDGPCHVTSRRNTAGRRKQMHSALLRKEVLVPGENFWNR